jgi:hypothetical protein
MKKLILVAGALLALAGGGAASALQVTDPTGDFLASFVGPNDADLDVTFFSAYYDAAASEFDLAATLAGPINPATAGLYVIGVNTGTGVAAPFADIGQPDVRFNQVIAVLKSGTATVFGSAGPTLTATIDGANFSLSVPLSRLPATVAGFAPEDYGFNLWPRTALGPNPLISDFAPNNAMLAAAVPEPATWALMILGFGAAGGALRRRRSGSPVAASA